MYLHRLVSERRFVRVRGQGAAVAARWRKHPRSGILRKGRVAGGMHMKKVLAAVLLAALLAGSMPQAAPAQEAPPRFFDQVSQKELCEAVQEVFRLRERRFQTILGEKSQYNDDSFKATYQLPGFWLCYVRKMPEWMSYSCAAGAPFGWRQVNYSLLEKYIEKVHARLSECIKPYATSRAELLGQPVIRYNIPPYKPDDNLRSAVVINVSGKSFVNVTFNTLPE